MTWNSNKSAKTPAINGIFEKSDKKDNRISVIFNELSKNDFSLLYCFPNPILLINPNLSIKYVNPAFEEITGFSQRELVGQKPPYAWWTAETSNELSTNQFKNILLRGSHQNEKICQKKGGDLFWRRATVTKIQASGKLKFYVSNWVDITERVHIANALKESENFNAKLLRHSPYPILVINPDLSIRYVNPAFAEVTGFSEKELVGQKPPYAWWTEDLRKQIDRYALNKILHHGVKRDEKLFRRKNGELFWREATTVKVEYNKKIKFYVSNWVDITERKRMEENLKKTNKQLHNLSKYMQTIRERERAHIARELHDDIGQDLTALKMDIFWVNQGLGKNQRLLVNKTQSMMKNVDMTLQTIKRIYAELRPRIFDELGLTAAVEWLIEEFQRTTGIICKLDINPRDIKLDRNRSATVFRILQQVLSNVFHHSNASLVDIKLSLKNKQLVLVINDNGKGVTHEQINSPKSFGLISMRERAQHYGGKVEINAVKNRGTKVLLEISLKKVAQADA